MSGTNSDIIAHMFVGHRRHCEVFDEIVFEPKLCCIDWTDILTKRSSERLDTNIGVGFECRPPRDVIRSTKAVVTYLPNTLRVTAHSILLPLDDSSTDEEVIVSPMLIGTVLPQMHRESRKCRLLGVMCKTYISTHVLFSMSIVRLH